MNGHTFWFMEELFVAPLHWMFVFFGWFSLAVSALRCRFLAVSKNLRTAMKICSVSSRLNKLSARVEDPWV